jgi:hypothetical protein
MHDRRDALYASLVTRLSERRKLAAGSERCASLPPYSERGWLAHRQVRWNGGFHAG